MFLFMKKNVMKHFYAIANSRVNGPVKLPHCSVSFLLHSRVMGFGFLWRGE